MQQSTDLAVATKTAEEGFSQIRFDAALRERAGELVAGVDVSKLTLQQVLDIGRDTQLGLSHDMDALLGSFAKRDNLLVYEALDAIRKGWAGVNLEELEAEIKKANEPGWLRRWFASSASINRAKAAFVDKLSEMIRQKRETLESLVKEMEEQAKKEMEWLLGNMDKIDALANIYTRFLQNIAAPLLVIDQLLGVAGAHYTVLLTEAKESGDPIKKYEADQYGLLVEQIRNRRLILLYAYESVPYHLDTIGAAKQATANTFIEISSSLVQQLNDTKSAAIKWALLVVIENAQEGDKLRQQMATLLMRHGVNVLDRVALVAAKTPYERRLADAQLLTALNQSFFEVQRKLNDICERGRLGFKEAEKLLGNARQPLLAA